MDILPPVFKDACTLTRHLGYRYLWIDSLCILQDQDQIADWVEQAAQMGKIYKDAVLCISADASPNSRIGIFEANNVMRAEEAKRPKVKVPYYNSQFPVKKPCYIYPIPLSRHEVEDAGPLGTRAWAFQESALSSRELIWTNLELKWHCRTTTLREMYPWCEMPQSNYNFKQELALATLSEK
jgi:hypothetical protein